MVTGRNGQSSFPRELPAVSGSSFSGRLPPYLGLVVRFRPSLPFVRHDYADVYVSWGGGSGARVIERDVVCFPPLPRSGLAVSPLVESQLVDF